MSETNQQSKPNIIKGHEVIQSYLKTLDGSPGVYRMLNQDGEVLYVGKARNLMFIKEVSAEALIIWQ